MPAPLVTQPWDDDEVVEQPKNQKVEANPWDQDEPVKKKDVTALNSPSGKDSGMDGKPSEKSSPKTTPISSENTEIFNRLGREAKGEKETPQVFDLEKEKVIFKKTEKERKDFQENKIQNPLKSAAKSIWGVLRYDIPSSALALAAATTSGEGSGGQFSGIGSQIKDIQAGRDVNEEAKKRALKTQLNLILKASEIQKEGAEDRKYLVNTLDKVSDPIDAVNWVSSALGQATGQIPLTIATGGASSFTQEVGSIYLDGIKKISEETGKSFEQIIKDGDDESLAPLLFGFTAAALDLLGASKVMKSFTQKDVLNAYRSRAGAVYSTAQTEGVTETAQSTLESLGVSKMAGKTWAQSIMEVDTDALIESYFQGVVGGGAGATVGQMTQKKTIPAVMKNVDVNNPVSVQEAANEIQTIVENGNAGTTTNISDSNNGTPSSVNEPVAPTTNIDQGSTIESTPETPERQPAQEPAAPEPEPTTTTTAVKEPQLAPLDQAKKTAKEKIDALVASGDVSFENGKVTILTEKGGEEVFKIREELDKARNENNTQQQPPSSEETNQTPTEGDTTGGLPTTNTKDTNEPTEQTEEPSSEELQSGVDSPKQQLSGIKKALVPLEKTDSTPIEKRSTEEMLTQAREKVESGQIDPRAIVDEIAIGKARALQPDEVSALVYYKTQLDNKSTNLNNALVKAIEGGDTQSQVSLRSQIAVVEDQIDRYHTMSLKTAYEQSLAFRLRQMLLDNEFNLQTQINRYKAVNNGIIPSEVEEKFREYDTQLKQANAKISELESQRAKAEEDATMEALKRDAETERKKRAKLITDEDKKKIASLFDSMKIKDVGGTVNDVVRVLGSAVWNGSLDVVKTAIISGANAVNAVQAGIDYIKQNYTGSEFNEEEYRQMIQPSVEQSIPKPKDKKVKPEKAPTQPSLKEDGTLNIPNSIIRAIVADGASTIQEVVDKVFPIVKEIIPEITEREVLDAVTGYGKIRAMSKDELSKKVRDIKGVGRLISALEDVTGGKRPKRSGLQRDKPTDEQRRLQREVKEKMKDIPLSEEETAQNWKTALDAVKARLENSIKDIQRQIDLKEKNPPKKGIEYDQEATDLKRRRDTLREELNELVGKPEMSDEQKVKMAIKRAEAETQKIEDKVNSKKISYDSAKKPLPETTELREARRRLKEARERLEQMRKDEGLAEQRQLDIYKKAVKKAIQQYEDRITNKDFQGKVKAEKPIDVELQKLMVEREHVKERFQIEQEKNRLANRPFGEKLKDFLIDVANLPKSLVSSVDLSAPFRQGAVLSSGNPRAAARSFIEMFRQAFSKARANDWLGAVKQSDIYPVMKASGLYLAEPHVKMAAKEEAFLSNIAERIPVYGRVVSGSQRAYTGYLNKLRVDVFNAGADNLMSQGITPQNNPKAYEAWAIFINNATGRGEFNSKTLENATPLLNAFMFSPRYLVSRINLLNPITYSKMPAPVRRMALKNMISYIGLGTMVLIMASAAGADVEEDPRSSDFGKIKIGNTRYDIWAGFQQIIRFVAQFSMGQRKSTKTGKIQDLDGTGWNKETRKDIAENFIRSKASPIVGSVWNLMEGENMVGEKTSVYDEAVRNVLPLYIQDMIDISGKEGPTMLLQTAIPAIFGIGVQNYDPKSKKKKEKKAPVKAWVDKKVKQVKSELE